MLTRIHKRLVGIRRHFSRGEWAVRWLRMDRQEAAPTQPGLILIQIDGLSMRDFRRAMEKGRLPFLESLLKREHYALRSFYSGLPSSTPAVQGELFYGVRTAVPAFSFYQRDSHKVATMFASTAVEAVEERLRAAGAAPLLKDGSAYSDIYSGGASEMRFCSLGLGWGNFLGGARPLFRLLWHLAHAMVYVRTAGLMAFELALAVVDFIRGLAHGKDFWMELKFIPTRVAICILLREFVTAGVKMDIARGMPVIHANFVGYDEQAHRRGPTSAFAHWTLRGIDLKIRSICRAARRGQRRDYDIWIYSDHGQEETIPYLTARGRTIQEAVAEAIGEQGVRDFKEHTYGVMAHRARLLGGRLAAAFGNLVEHADDPEWHGGALVTAMGPIGHVYLTQPPPAQERDAKARALIDDAGIPLVLAPDEPGRALAWTEKGTFELPRDAAAVLGAEHPFLDEAVRDLVDLVNHPQAGDFTISGWRTDDEPITFPVEQGSHAGPGWHETHGFALLPDDAPLEDPDLHWMRPMDLRNAALRDMKRSESIGRHPAPAPRAVRPGALRIMTYNTHSCIGVDGKCFPERIARLIAQWEPDIVCLQELDVGRRRTFGADQAEQIALLLDMKFHFHAAMCVGDEQYGNAILSRLPIRLVRSGPLPRLNHSRLLEARGALWAAIQTNGHEIHVVNTHLSLSPRERLLQANALIGTEWLHLEQRRSPVFVCGDFNSVPGTRSYRVFADRLLDVQMHEAAGRPDKTWFSRVPLGRLDHIFAPRGADVLMATTPKNQLARMASDHLPLVVDVKV